MANEPQSGFDVNGARQAGYSDDEILSHLTSTRSFDVDSAIKSGYSKQDIIGYLATRATGTGQADTKKPGFLERAEKWWTTPTEDLPPLGKGGTHAPGEPAPKPSFSTPQEKTRASLESAGIMSAPLMVPALASAPGATLLGLGGGVLGGTAGSMGGRYLGEQVGAPELGSDVGGMAGSLLGGYAGSRVPGLAKNALVDATGRPKPLALLTLGSDRARALGELVDPELAASRSALQARFDAMRAGQTAPGPWRPGMKLAPAPPPEVFPVSQSPGPYRGPSSVPKPEPLQGRPSLFPAATSSAKPVGTAELPKTGGAPSLKPDVKIVSAFKTEETPTSRIIQPGTPEAKPPAVQGSYWSFDKGSLRNAVLLGDRDAAIVYKQRFGELPAGAGYLTDVGQAPTSGLYRGRE